MNHRMMQFYVQLGNSYLMYCNYIQPPLYDAIAYIFKKNIKLLLSIPFEVINVE